MKLSVLFVDDDASIIGGLKRMMYPMRGDWELLYANGGKEALEMLEQNKVDVIISDIRMPGIDGTQLLTQVKELYPKVVRITLSGYQMIICHLEIRELFINLFQSQQLLKV